MVETPSSATTSYSYDDAGRVLTENRTGASPYASTYTYNSRGLRATSFRSEGGTTSHNGTYTYNDASRLTLVTQPGLSNENYTWYADGTLASLPGSGVTRNLDYDEEGRMTVLKHNSTTKFEFGYGFDGGRRWTKEIAADKWSWFPCGVACSAGELVEMQSTLAGSSWATVSTNLKGPGCSSGLARGGTQWVLKDLLGRVSRSTDGSGNTVATAIFDMDGVARYGTGTLSSAVIRDTYGSGNEDGLLAFLRSRLLRQFPNPWVLHGRWCGISNGGPGEPIDAVDRCCMEHDKCLSSNPFFAAILFRHCACAMVACLATRTGGPLWCIFSPNPVTCVLAIYAMSAFFGLVCATKGIVPL
jgi:hypothetical protein